MKFSHTHKVFSIVLSFLVLFSTLSLTIEKHFCGDVLIDVAVFSTSDKCGMEMSEMNKTQISNKSCCKNEIDVIEGIDEFAKESLHDIDHLQQKVLIVYSLSYINLFEALPNSIILNKEYSPPKLIEDIQLLDETYLI